MKTLKILFIISALAIAFNACQSPKAGGEVINASAHVIQPVLVSDSVLNDSDDPAIWINNLNASASLVIGTDKGGDVSGGGLYVFDLTGKEIIEKRVSNLKRPNNVDVGYGLNLAGELKDIAVCTERNTNSLRVFALPEMTPIDNGGIPVFEGDSLRAPMGIALYKTSEGRMYAFVSRKKGPSGSYLWQYELKDNGNKIVSAMPVRKFGNFNGGKEIESIAVDDDLGYVYYSDEGAGVHKYYAHPDSSNLELALFATSGFSEDHEGISIYKLDKKTGYILVSDQGANQFQIFTREGSPENPHEHRLVRVVKLSTNKSDGSEVVSTTLPGFPGGLFVAMSDDKTFQFYRWQDIAGQELKTQRIQNSISKIQD
jgi:3-phytase